VKFFNSMRGIKAAIREIKTASAQELPETIRITREDIAANDDDPQSIIDPLWWAVSIYDGPEKYEADLSRFSLPQRLVLAIQWYVAEVGNGGHDQFFYNSTGIVWKDALRGFQEIGHEQAEQILRSAADKLGGDPPLEREARQELLEKCEADFSGLDARLYEISDLDTVIMRYVKANAEAFVFEGTVKKPD
jgi:hypothetical protein